MAINVNQPTIQAPRTAGSKSNFDTPGDRSSQFNRTREVKRRLIVLASALQKHGKDHFGFTAPGPIALHAFDEGWEETRDKFVRAGKQIDYVEYDVPEPISKSKDTSIEQEAGRIWDEFKENFLWSLDHYRSLVIDTSTEQWELIRLARFGAHSTGQTTSFGPVNAEFRKLIREAYNHNANVIFLQKLGKKYVNREWSGDYEPKGFGDMAFEVQVVIRLYREDPNIFHTYIEDCRQEPILNGQDLTGAINGLPLNDFPALASMIYNNGDPFVGRKEWE